MPNVCAEGSLDVYYGSAGGADQQLYYCLTDHHVADVPAGIRLAIFKSSGGSGDGVEPLVTNSPMPFMSFSVLQRRGCSASTRIVPTGDLAAMTEHRGCDGGEEMRVPDAGISDLEPELFGSDSSDLVERSLSQLVWGLPVSKNFRNALQALQGLVPAEVAHDDERREAEAAMPVLSNTVISSIFAGSINRWSQFFDRTGTAIVRSAYLPEDAPADPDISGATPGAYRPNKSTGDRIFVCRRIDASGTQVAYGAHYLRQACTANATPFVSPNDGSDAVLGGDPAQLLDRPIPRGNVFAGRGTSDVRACLDMHDDHNRWAIGMFSTENKGDNVNREFRYVKLDGYAPSLINAHHGRWRHVSAASMQWTRATAESGGRKAALLEFLANHMGQPAVTRSLNDNFRHSWGDGGYLAIVDDQAPTGTSLVTEDLLSRYPVAGVSHAQGSVARNCLVPVLTGNTSIDP